MASDFPPIMLKGLHLVQFRNYQQASFAFTAPVTGIAGRNGMGKTNLLDAIYYLCFTRSYFSRTDASGVHFGSAGWRIEGQLCQHGTDTRLVCILRENNRKEFTVDGQPYKKFSAHIGRFPAVMIAPDDVELVSGGSEERRKFLDTLLSQLSPDYLENLIQYNRILQQRNSLLKAAAEHQRADETVLEALDEQLVARGNAIYRERSQLMSVLQPLVHEQYYRISGRNDELSLQYVSSLQQGDFRQQLADNRSRDFFLQRTGVGVHRDDIEFLQQGQHFRSIASQGQRKSLLFALKLAEYALLKQHKGFAPFLLLDDVFEKLDEERMYNLLQMVCTGHEGQVFITDTHRDRLQRAFSETGARFGIVELGL